MWRSADPPNRYPLTRHLVCNRLLLRRPFSFETSVSRERTCKEGRIVKFACGTGTDSTGTRGGGMSRRSKTTVQSRKPGRLFQSKPIPVPRCREPPFNVNTSVPELCKPTHSSGCKAFHYTGSVIIVSQMCLLLSQTCIDLGMQVLLNCARLQLWVHMLCCSSRKFATGRPDLR